MENKTLHFKNKKNYQKWLAYNYIHNKSKMGDGKNKNVVIKGKKHKVEHPKKVTKGKSSSKKK